MLDDLLQATIIVSIFASTLRIATPILLSALGELVTERSGVLNLGVEGMMLMSAFTAFMVTFFSDSIWLGVLAAAVTGGLMAFLMVFMAATLRVEQIVRFTSPFYLISLISARFSFPTAG
jgi:simple sugar transport system permease protein